MRLKEQIRFMVFQTLHEIRSNFKWSEFKKIDDHFDRALYLINTGTQVLGEGTSRLVFLLSNRFVLKLAQLAQPLPRSPRSFERGKAQNKYEVDLSTDPDVKPIVAEVYDAADDYSWIVSELVRPIKNINEFKDLTGFSFTDFRQVLKLVFEGELENTIEKHRKLRQRYIEEINRLDSEDTADKTNIEYYKSQLEAIEKVIEYQTELPEHPMVQAAIELISDKGAMAADMIVLDHWGKTADGRVVLLDYGYSRDVARKHYDVTWI